ncbi:GNAT family N-acetyltransferase [Legionella nagasakiensis]|uniref:GNAT family N-acetyltransferase n=1 Tax=Legionella nagasakiensis TaxID=535290 RepID=UPI001054B57B|nr:GNAT family N-acetyltransferase [Legionella nagasakiensis]
MGLIIETDRLLLRPPQPEDAIPLNQAIHRSLSELQRWMPWSKDPSLAITQDFIQKAMAQWDTAQQTDFPLIIVYKPKNIIVGSSGYNEHSNPQVPFFEIGYWLDTRYTGLGLAVESTIALTKHAFEILQAKRVQICIQAENKRSIRVAEKCGFELEARLRYHRVDCDSKKPADDLIYTCFSPANLPHSPKF